MRLSVLLGCLLLLCAKVCPAQAQIDTWGSKIDGAASSVFRTSPDLDGFIVFTPLSGRVGLMAPLSRTSGTVRVTFRWTEDSKPQERSFPFSIERLAGQENTPYLRSMGDDVVEVCKIFRDASIFVIVEYEDVVLEFNAIGFSKTMREVLRAAR